MNKQELIKKLEERRTITGSFQGYVVWWKDVKEIFEQLIKRKFDNISYCNCFKSNSCT